MKYTVYLRTNTVNGKQYVGQTNNLEQRNHQFNSLKCKCNKYLDEDRIKFGVDYFNLEILAEVETREEACRIEKDFITKLGTIYPNGYNKVCRGKNNSGCGKGNHNGKEFKKGNKPWNKGVKNCFNNETLKKMSDHNAKYWLGKHLSKDTGKKISNKLKGIKRSEETKEKNRQAKLGTISKKRKPVIRFTLNWEYIKEYTHAEAAAQELGFKSDESIRKACKETWRTSGGSKWMYKSDYEKLLEGFASQELN